MSERMKRKAVCGLFAIIFLLLTTTSWAGELGLFMTPVFGLGMVME